MVEERKVWWKTVASIGLGMAAVVALVGGRRDESEYNHMVTKDYKVLSIHILNLQ